MQLLIPAAPLVLLLVIVGLFAVLTRLRSPERSIEQSAYDFAKKPLLTPNELEFLGRLEGALPEYRILCQVAMGALLRPGESTRGNGRRYYATRGKFAQKIVDFVAQDRRSGMVMVIIELDGRSHRVEKDRARDEMLAAAGYRTVRFSSQPRPNGDQIRRAVLNQRAAPTPIIDRRFDFAEPGRNRRR